MNATAASSFDARHGLHALKGLTLMFFYALPDEQGLNPNWEALGYPGPNSPAPSADDAPKTIRIEDVSGPSATLTADVCVVGSGAGGAVVAAGCAQAGLSVLVLEMGAYRNEADFNQLEIPGMFELYLGRRPADVRERLDRGARGLDARRRDGRQLHELHQDAAAHPRRMGGARPGGHRRAGVRARSHRCRVGAARHEHRDDAPERHAPIADAGTRRARPGAPADRAQRVSHRRPGVLRLLLDGLPARLQALHDEDLAAGRIRRGCAVRRAVQGRPGADGGGRAAGVAATVVAR